MIQGTKIIEASQNVYSFPLLLKSILIGPINYMPQNEIVYRDKKRYDYFTFYRRIKKLATGIKEIGVKPGDVVAVLDWDSHRYLECYFAVPGIGAIMHSVNIRLSPEQILYTMNHAEDAVVLIHEDFVPIIADVKNRFKTVRKWILLKDDEAESRMDLSFDAEYEAVLALGRDDFEFPDFDENSIATLFYTTGTTGDPKGVYYSHRQLVVHTMGVAIAMGAYHANGRFNSSDVYMPITPMFHVHAWGFPYVATLLGVKQVYPGRYDPEVLLQLISSENVTFSHCVPTILHMLLNSPLAQQIDFSDWKVMVGGASFPRGLAKMALDLGIDAYAAYGMSETAPVLTVAHLKPDKLDADETYQLEVRTTTGLPLPFVDLRVVDSEMNDVPRDGKTPGEIVVRAPWLTQGYYKSPTKTEELWSGGYLHTGDMAHMNPEGYVRITDRIKDVIKTGGEWISSLELESLISQHPLVSEVAVVGIQDEKWGERPVAMIVAAHDQASSFSENDIIGFMAGFVDNGTIPKYAVPDRFVLVDKIPKTSVGKLDKKVIRRQIISLE